MASQLSERASGVLLHPTSLPGAHGSGDLGPEAHAFARWLGEAEQGWWQMLPIGPVGYGNSPYSAHSAFAGNPLLISLDSLVQEGLLERASPAGAPAFPKGRVDHAASRAWRNRHLRAAFAAFSKRAADRCPFEDFCAQNAAWLEDFALFMAIKHTRGERLWTDWDPDLRAREPAALARARQALADEVHQHRFEQFLFARQWQSLRDQCRTLGVGLIGDIPIFVAHDSSDVWTHPDLFCLDRKGHPTVVAGVPPDYFSRTGQRWGNPLYDWEKIERTGFRWWLQRFAHAFARFDAVRLDHFIGFTRYWEVPAREPTAEHGRWRPGPGAKLFQALGPAQLIAEDLGEVTPEVTALRDRFRLPGIKVLQFAFGTDPQAPTFQPHSYQRNSVAYTGTHLAGIEEPAERAEAAFRFGTRWVARHQNIERGVELLQEAFAADPSKEAAFTFLREIWGTKEGNWEWRLSALPPADVRERLRQATRIYGRSAR